MTTKDDVMATREALVNANAVLAKFDKDAKARREPLVKEVAKVRRLYERACVARVNAENGDSKPPGGQEQK